MQFSNEQIKAMQLDAYMRGLEMLLTQMTAQGLTATANNADGAAVIRISGVKVITDSAGKPIGIEALPPTVSAAPSQGGSNG